MFDFKEIGLDFWKVFKTILYGLIIAVAPAATQYLMGIDWNHIFSFLGPYSTVAAMFVTSVVAGVAGWFTPPPQSMKKD